MGGRGARGLDERHHDWAGRWVSPAWRSTRTHTRRPGQGKHEWGPGMRAAFRAATTTDAAAARGDSPPRRLCTSAVWLPRPALTGRVRGAADPRAGFVGCVTGRPLSSSGAVPPSHLGVRARHERAGRRRALPRAPAPAGCTAADGRRGPGRADAETRLWSDMTRLTGVSSAHPSPAFPPPLHSPPTPSRAGSSPRSPPPRPFGLWRAGRTGPLCSRAPSPPRSPPKGR
jgi:hypothetical protein